MQTLVGRRARVLLRALRALNLDLCAYSGSSISPEPSLSTSFVSSMMSSSRISCPSARIVFLMSRAIIQRCLSALWLLLLPHGAAAFALLGRQLAEHGLRGASSCMAPRRAMAVQAVAADLDAEDAKAEA